MKKFSVRKIVLSSIGLFASIMLLIGLSFNVICYEMSGLNGSQNSAVSGALGLEANGFTMLSFKLPDILRASVLTYVEEDFCGLFEVLLGVTSLLSLIVSIAIAALIVLAFFRFTPIKNEKTLKSAFIVGIILSLAHGILSIVFTSIVQSCMNEFCENLSSSLGSTQSSLGKFSSSAIVSVILQVIFLIAYVVCAKTIKEKDVLPVTAVKSNIDAPKEDAKSKETALENLIASELNVAVLLTEYKELYDAQIISTADYMDKKVKLLRFSGKRIKDGIAVAINKCSFESIIKMEKQVIKVLKEYDKLVNAGIISDSDFIEKKVTLLSSVIN